MALHFWPDMPIKPHNALCCKNRVDGNAVKLFKMGQAVTSCHTSAKASGCDFHQ